MTWNLYEGGKFLEPLKFSNGKTQEDVVKEVVRAVKEGNKIIFIHGKCGTGKCLDKNSLIFCKPEKEEGFSYHRICEIEGKEGEIISLNEEGKLVQTKFINVRKTGQKKLYKIVTKTGREIIASKNHPFLTITKEGPEWKKLEELDDTNYLCLSNQINLENSFEYDENEIKVLGHLIAEGKLGDRAGSPKYYQNKYITPLIRKDYEESLKKLFPDGEIRNSHKTEVTIVFNNKDTRFGTTNKLRLLIKKYGLDGKRSDEKFVPEIIFNLDKKGIALFLSRLFSGDGSIYIRNNNQIVIEYSSISKRLIQDISILLQIFEIQHTITTKKFRDNKEYSWRISISNHHNLKKFIDNIGFVGEKQKKALKIFSKLKEHKFTNIDKVPRVIREYLRNKAINYKELDDLLTNKNIKQSVFSQGKINFLRCHLEKVNETIKDKKISFICNRDILWDRIKSIEFIKEGETYDLEVPKSNNFIANGIIVHNSAIALNIARELGKASVVVPSKALQQQYKQDYEENKYLLNSKNKKLKISVITGRNNHKCKFLEDNKNAIPEQKKEVNSKLYDIFEGRRERLKELISKDLSADNKNIPCKIELKEKNFNTLKEYLKQNKKINPKNFDKVSDIKRMSIAPVCPYWSPVVPEEYDVKNLDEKEKIKYRGLQNKNFYFYRRQPGCGFYEQFNSYVDSDIIVFNSLKYKLESALNRKPCTEVEIIDECDEFLDSFSNQRNINIDRLQNSLSHATVSQEENFQIIREINEILNHLKRNNKVNELIRGKGIIELKKTGLYDLFKIFIKNSEFTEEIDEESYVHDVASTIRMFDEFLDETYVLFDKREDNLIASIVTINLAKKFQEMVNKNKVVVLMSGTLHSNDVLSDIFGIDKFKIIEAETEDPGKINVLMTGEEMDCRYSNFSSGKAERKKYLQALDKCIEIAKKPVLIHVNSFGDLPDRFERENFDLKHAITREDLIELQIKDKESSMVKKFKEGRMNILFSTKCSRGVDFPGDECRTIIFTKFPNPNVQDAFWKILNKTNPQKYWSFYKDKARREILQKIYRGVRFKQDEVTLMSPDLRVLNFFKEKPSS